MWLFQYIVAIIVLLSMLYREIIGKVAIVSIWIIFALAMVDTMIMVMYNISMDLFNLNGELISNLVVSIVSLALVYSISKMFKRNSNAGIKSIRIANLFWYAIYKRMTHLHQLFTWKNC